MCSVNSNIPLVFHVPAFVIKPLLELFKNYSNPSKPASSPPASAPPSNLQKSETSVSEKKYFIPKMKISIEPKLKTSFVDIILTAIEYDGVQLLKQGVEIKVHKVIS